MKYKETSVSNMGGPYQRKFGCGEQGNLRPRPEIIGSRAINTFTSRLRLASGNYRVNYSIRFENVASRTILPSAVKILRRATRSNHPNVLKECLLVRFGPGMTIAHE